jgi:hypothetical protein
MNHGIEAVVEPLLHSPCLPEIASPTVAGFCIPVRAIFEPAENLATLRRFMTA